MFLTSLNAEAQLNLANSLKNYGPIFTAGANSYLIGLIFTVLPIISYWFLFEKKGVSGWKTIIPIYGTYMQYKLFFKTGKFWRLFFASILFFVGFIVLLFGSLISRGQSVMSDHTAYTIIAGLLIMFFSVIWILIISLQYDISICKRYGRGFLFTLGMIFVTPLFLGILAYEVYKGRAKEV